MWETICLPAMVVSQLKMRIGTDHGIKKDRLVWKFVQSSITLLVSVHFCENCSSEWHQTLYMDLFYDYLVWWTFVLYLWNTLCFMPWDCFKWKLQRFTHFGHWHQTMPFLYSIYIQSSCAIFVVTLLLFTRLSGCLSSPLIDQMDSEHDVSEVEVFNTSYQPSNMVSLCAISSM